MEILIIYPVYSISAGISYGFVRVGLGILFGVGIWFLGNVVSHLADLPLILLYAASGSFLPVGRILC